MIKINYCFFYVNDYCSNFVKKTGIIGTQPFQFKQFTVAQDQCAMKIGTDGVLLGAWAPLDSNPFSILDVGTGTGVIALMLAQRSHAEIIDAIEIDDDAYEQATTNFENAIWNDRLFCYHASFLEFASEIDDTYDLIISNPPFYTEDYITNNPSRTKARFADALPFEHLLAGTRKLLAPDGEACFIIPFREEENFISLAESMQLFPKKITHVRGNQNSDLIRSLLCFSGHQTNTVEINELIIEKDRHDYTDEYIALTHAFYMKM